MLMQNWVGQIRCIMGNVEVAYCSLLLVVYKKKKKKNSALRKSRSYTSDIIFGFAWIHVNIACTDSYQIRLSDRRDVANIKQAKRK